MYSIGAFGSTTSLFIPKEWEKNLKLLHLSSAKKTNQLPLQNPQTLSPQNPQALPPPNPKKGPQMTIKKSHHHLTTKGLKFFLL